MCFPTGNLVFLHQVFAIALLLFETQPTVSVSTSFVLLGIPLKVNYSLRKHF